jgi:hypothetical protein
MSYLPNASELYIYLEQELQSFGLWGKWSEDDGHWRPTTMILKVVNSFNTIFPQLKNMKFEGIEIALEGIWYEDNRWKSVRGEGKK